MVIDLFVNKVAITIYCLIIFNPKHQIGDDLNKQAFKKVLTHFKEVILHKQDWKNIKTIFIQTAPDSIEPILDDDPHLFYNNKRTFEHNITKLLSLRKPITKLKAHRTSYQAANMESKNYNGLQIKFYPCEEAEVMLTSNFWANTRLHNAAKVKVVNFFTTMKKVQKVAIFLKLLLYIFKIRWKFEPFLPGIPQNIAISVVHA